MFFESGLLLGCQATEDWCATCGAQDFRNLCAVRAAELFGSSGEVACCNSALSLFVAAVLLQALTPGHYGRLHRSDCAGGSLGSLNAFEAFHKAWLYRIFLAASHNVCRELEGFTAALLRMKFRYAVYLSRQT